MVVKTFLCSTVIILCAICLSSSSRLSTTRNKRASFIPRYFTNSPSSSKCSSIINRGCCQHSSCCLYDCCCDQVCHDTTFNDCCSDITDVGCFASDAPRNCRAAGHTSGCCVESDNQNCFVPAGNCSCASSCHQQGNCCPDIEAIRCAAPMNCSAAGHTDGCCLGGAKNDCYVAANNCSCDIACHHHGNCCPDITDIGCLAPPTTPPPITGCVSEGYINGCCSGRRCNIRVKGRRCSCSQTCYSQQRRNGNTCCEDIKEIHCYPQTCRQASMQNCKRTKQNNCSFQIAQNGSLCYCGEGCVPGSRCCEPMEYLNAQASRLRAQLMKMQKVINNLKENVEQTDSDSVTNGLSYNDILNYILVSTLHGRRSRQYFRKFGELSHNQKSFGDELREKGNQLSSMIEGNKRGRKEETSNNLYSRLHQIQEDSQKLKASTYYPNGDKTRKMLYLANIMQAINRQK